MTISSIGSRVLARVVQHYLIGFDRPTPGQQKTISPSDDITDLPDSDVALVDFSRRLSAKAASMGVSGIAFSAAPWHDLVLLGRLEKTLDSANPPRSVEHIHVILVDPVDADTKIVTTPSKFADGFVNAEQYSLFPESFAKFSTSIAERLALGDIFSTSASSARPYENSSACTISHILTALERLNNSTSISSLDETTDVLHSLPAVVANRITWTSSGSTNISVAQRDAIGRSAASDSSNESTTDLFTETHTRITNQLFDLLFPSCSIDVAIKLAIEIIGGAKSPTKSDDQLIVLGTTGLVAKGFAPERLLMSLVNNLVYLERAYGTSTTSMMKNCVLGLYSDNLRQKMSELGFPYLASLLTGTSETTAKSSSKESNLASTVQLDSEYRSYSEGVKNNPQSAVSAILKGTSGHPEHGLVLALTNVDSRVWTDQARDILLMKSEPVNDHHDSLLTITKIVSDSEREELASKWFEIVQQAATEKRGLLSKWAGRNNDVSTIIQSAGAIGHSEFLIRLADSFEPPVWESPPTALTRLISKLNTE